MQVEKLNAEMAEREAAIKQLVERDNVLAEEIKVRSQERSQLKVQYDQQQGALAQLKKLLEEPVEEGDKKAKLQITELQPGKKDK